MENPSRLCYADLCMKNFFSSRFFHKTCLQVFVFVFGCFLWTQSAFAEAPFIGGPTPQTVQGGQEVTLTAPFYGDVGNIALQCVFRYGNTTVPATVTGSDPNRTLTYTGTFPAAGASYPSGPGGVYFICSPIGWGSENTIEGLPNLFTVLPAPVMPLVTIGAFGPTTLASSSPSSLLSTSFTTLSGSRTIAVTEAVNTCEFFFDGIYYPAAVSGNDNSDFRIRFVFPIPFPATHILAAPSTLERSAYFVCGTWLRPRAWRGPQQTLTLFAESTSTPPAPTPTADVIQPVVSAPSPALFTVGQATLVSLSLVETSPVTCQLSSRPVGGEGTLLANMTVSAPGVGGSRTASALHTFSAVPTVQTELYAVCVDDAFNVGASPATSVVVQSVSVTPPVTPSVPPLPTSDVTPPSVGGIGSFTVMIGSPISFSTTYTDAGGIRSCSLLVNGSDVGTGSLSATLSGSASRAYTFPAQGTYMVGFRCVDLAGNVGTGFSGSIIAQGSTPPSVTPPPVTPSAPPPVTPPPNAPAQGRLIKLQCPAGRIDTNHPCKTVYYYGADGKRHGFPNERVFFTWYRDFSSVSQVSATELASIALGRNVTYRPGVRMVKFATVSNVFAVGRGGVLRWVTSEAVAIALYGQKWNGEIDDLSDALFANYTFGSDILSGTDYGAMSEIAGTLSIDQNW